MLVIIVILTTLTQTIPDYIGDRITLLEFIQPLEIYIEIYFVLLPYYIWSPGGPKPDTNKIDAIKGMLHPTDTQSLRRFLGMVTYLAKFLPGLPDETEVLKKRRMPRCLTEKDCEWYWLPAHEDAMTRIQKMITTAPVLRLFSNSSVTY
jgi:hypothetical protein